MKAALKRSITILVAIAVSLSFAGSVSLPSHAESTLEKLQKAKKEKEKTEEAKDNTQDRKESLQITKNSLLGQLSTLMIIWHRSAPIWKALKRIL